MRHMQHDHNLLGIEDEFYAIKADLPENYFNRPQVSSTNSKSGIPLLKKLSWDKFKKVLIAAGILTGIPVVIYLVLAISMIVSSLV